jgi:hypothetical protein
MRLEAAFPFPLSTLIRVLNPTVELSELANLSQRQIVQERIDLDCFEAIRELWLPNSESQEVQELQPLDRPSPGSLWAQAYERTDHAAHSASGVVYLKPFTLRWTESSPAVPNIFFSKREGARRGWLAQGLDHVQLMINGYVSENYLHGINHIIETVHSISCTLSGLSAEFDAKLRLAQCSAQKGWDGSPEHFFDVVTNRYGVERELMDGMFFERPLPYFTDLHSQEEVLDLDFNPKEVVFADVFPLFIEQLLLREGLVEDHIWYETEVLIRFNLVNEVKEAADLGFQGETFSLPQEYQEYFEMDGGTPWMEFYHNLLFRSVVPSNLTKVFESEMSSATQTGLNSIAVHFPFWKGENGLTFANAIPPYLAEPLEDNFPSERLSRGEDEKSLLSFLGLSSTRPPGMKSSDVYDDVYNLHPDAVELYGQSFFNIYHSELFRSIVNAKSMEDLELLGLFEEVEETRSGLLQATLIIYLWPEVSHLSKERERITFSLMAAPFSPHSIRSRDDGCVLGDSRIRWIEESMTHLNTMPELGQFLALSASIASLSWVNTNIRPSRKTPYVCAPDDVLLETIQPIQIERRSHCKNKNFNTQLNLLIDNIRAHKPTFNVDSHTQSTLRVVSRIGRTDPRHHLVKYLGEPAN